jgi:hypothetical protein
MKPGAPYPKLFRIALLAAVTVGALVSFSAAQGMSLAIMAPDLSRDDDAKLDRLPGLVPYANVQEEALKASRRAHLGAVEAMGGSRVVILLGLSASASIVFLSALFLRWSTQAPKPAIARRLGWAAVAAAIFRTLDGAQELVITRRSADAGLKVLVEKNVPDVANTAGYAVGVLSALTIGWTALVVALFVALWSYFRSDKVRTLLEAAPKDES